MSDQNLTDWRKLGLKLEAEINKVILGQVAPIRLITNAIFARGHVLLEGDVVVCRLPLCVVELELQVGPAAISSYPDAERLSRRKIPGDSERADSRSPAGHVRQ